VERLVARGDAARVMSRAPRALPDGVEGIVGDLADAERTSAAVGAASAVVISVEPPYDAAGAQRVLGDGVALAARAAAAAGGVPVVLVSQIYITRPDAYPSMAAVIEARRAGEEALRASGAPFTIVRPSWLTDAPGRGRVRVEQGERGDGEVSRDDVADACVAALDLPAARGVTFELYADDGAPPADWAALYASLAKDGPS